MHPFLTTNMFILLPKTRTRYGCGALVPAVPVAVAVFMVDGIVVPGFAPLGALAFAVNVFFFIYISPHCMYSIL